MKLNTVSYGDQYNGVTDIKYFSNKLSYLEVISLFDVLFLFFIANQQPELN